MDFNMNQDIIKGKWMQFKGSLQKAWGKITDDQWEQTKGDATKIAGLVQENYGDSKEEVSKKLRTIYNDFASAAENVKTDAEIELDKRNSDVRNKM